tara:strand:- start:558 stop:791 length:234 start_codon:yes stop_codon:yes gene_type:complete
MVSKSEHSNQDLLNAKTSHGDVYSESVMLREAIEMRSKYNRSIKHEELSPAAKEEILLLKKECNAKFENHTILHWKC